MYDFIGDVHGHALELEELLRTLGYRERDGCYRHPGRTAVFVGDFLDRGPEVRRAAALTRAMIEAGAARAVLGNHELNALAYHLPDPDRHGAFLRPHGQRNDAQHQATLVQVPPAELTSHLAFYRTLTFWIDLGPARVVHACWDATAFAVIDEALERHGGIDDAFLVEGHDPESLLYDALEIACKGREMDLPPGVVFHDKDGTERKKARVRWYLEPAGQTIASYALPFFEHLGTERLPEKVIAEAHPYPPDAPPVFFGHYWLDDPTPAPLAPNVCCLDYSVAKGGFLCAYRFDGEPAFDAGRFVTVRARPR